MKKIVFVILVILGIEVISCQVRTIKYVTDDFKIALGEENKIIASKLKRYGPIEDLRDLTYDNYIIYLEENQKNHEVKLIEKINYSDTLFFDSNSKEFLIVLFYSGDGKVVIDKSSTVKYDKVLTYETDLLRKDILFFARLVEYDYQTDDKGIPRDEF